VQGEDGGNKKRIAKGHSQNRGRRSIESPVRSEGKTRKKHDAAKKWKGGSKAIERWVKGSCQESNGASKESERKAEKVFFGR